MSQEFVSNFLETLNLDQRKFLNGVVNLDLDNELVIDHDIDDTDFDLAEKILKFCDEDLGTHYTGRVITGWSSLSKWLIEDGIFDAETASAYEEAIWTDPDVLASAEPNEAMQRLSYEAARRKIPQFVTTSRVPELRDVTFRQYQKHYPWILKENINHRTVADTTGEIYKAGRLAELAIRYPRLVHFDDSMSLVRRLKDHPVSFIGFPKVEDDISDLWAPNRVFIKDQSVLSGLIPFPKVNVAQSH